MNLKSLFNKKQEEKPTRDLVDFLNDSNYLTSELRFQHQLSNIQMRANKNEKVTPGMLLNRTFDVRKEEVSDMGIISNYFDKQLEIIHDSEEIWNYDLCKSILNIDEQGEISYKFGENVILAISYRKGGSIETDIDRSLSRNDESIIVHLRGTGAGHGSWFICATILIPSPAYEKEKTYARDQNKPKALSVLFAYDETDPKDRIAQYNYLKEDAFEKIRQEKYNEITEEQTWLLDQLHVNISKDYWWGNKVQKENRFWDAIIYFENVYNALQDQWREGTITDEGKDCFFKTCFRLGYCYNELQLYEKALFYLAIIYPVDNLDYKIEYINCLVNSKDFRAIYTIHDELVRISELNKEDITEHVIFYHNFLRRRRAYTFIDMGKFDKAEEAFKEMLDEDANKDYALDELAYIQKLREIMNARNKTNN